MYTLYASVCLSEFRINNTENISKCLLVFWALFESALLT